MIEVPSSPPVVTFGDINPGTAYRNGVNDPLIKTQSSGTAVRLDTGEVVTSIQDVQVITPAPQATFTLFPPEEE